MDGETGRRPAVGAPRPATLAGAVAPVMIILPLPSLCGRRITLVSRSKAVPRPLQPVPYPFPFTAPKASAALIPPKPKEFEIATRTFRASPVPVT